jgi:ureidoacrylate peracid hydrolase
MEDATHAAGPDFARKAALYNVEAFFGWVSTVADFSGAIAQTEMSRNQQENT